MDFLIENHVEFRQDHYDGSYIATVKVVNQNTDSRQPQVINGMDQMREIREIRN
jgi:hypothetical protein